MKKIVIIILLSVFYSSSFSQVTYRLEDFGLSLNRGQIDSKKMTQRQMDTIAICPINYEDQIPDICVNSNYQKEIIIYRNIGNGLIEIYKTIQLNKSAKKIEPSLAKAYPVILPTFYNLKITYYDGSEQIIYNRKINSFYSEPEPRVPKWNFLDDARVFVYDFTYIKSWQSERNGQPHSTLTLGDIDNDGKNEMVYTFYPVVDSGPPLYSPTRMVVFESIGRDQIRIDWDTILINGGGNAATHILTDFDRNGKKEFFAACTDPTNGWGTYGLFECSGEGKYRFWGIEDFLFLGPIVDVEYLDTMKIIDSTNNPGVWVNYYPSGFPPNYYNRISPYKYWRKSVTSGFGRYEFKTIGGSAVDFIRIPWRIDDIDVADIDRDGKDEIILGNLTETIDYMDSTGISGNLGFEFKSIIPGVPLSGGWIFTKDFDDDGYNEIISCGTGAFTGSIGIVKHTGAPGENQFTTMWWDTTGLVMRPNWGIDTGTVNNKFTVLYPTIDYNGPRDIENIITYSRDGIFGFYKSSFTVLDTTSFIQAKLFDIDKDNKMDIVAPAGIGFPPIKHYLCTFKMDNVTHASSNGTYIVATFKLNQNYPNPFNPTTIIGYELPTLPSSIGNTNYVLLKVFDIRGKEISTLVNQKQNSGRYEVEFDGSNLTSGIYFYSFTVDENIIDRKKMVFLK